MNKIVVISGVLVLLLVQGCTQPDKKDEAYYKHKMEAVIWDHVHYNTSKYIQEASRHQSKSISLDRTVLRLNTQKIKYLTKELYETTNSLSKTLFMAKVYYSFDEQLFTLLSHKVKNIIVTYVDDKLAHVYVSLVRQKAKKNKLSDTQIKNAVKKKFGFYDDNIKNIYMNMYMKEEPLADIKEVLNKKFGKAFYYGSAEANNDSNEVWTWGMHHNFYYKVVVNQDGKYAYLSIKSKAFMKKLAEEIIDVRKWQKKQDGIMESMVTVHKKDKK